MHLSSIKKVPIIYLENDERERDVERGGERERGGPVEALPRARGVACVPTSRLPPAVAPPHRCLAYTAAAP